MNNLEAYNIRTGEKKTRKMEVNRSAFFLQTARYPILTVILWSISYSHSRLSDSRRIHGALMSQKFMF